LITANVVTSTAIVFNNDGTAAIITANGPSGSSIRIVNLAVVSGRVTTLGADAVQLPAASAQLGSASQQPATPAGRK
jgi:hypothetical protein